MTIRKHEPWGTPGGLPVDGVVVRSDAEARAVVTAARQAGAPVPPLGLRGGDLCHTLGGGRDEEAMRSPDALIFPTDLGSVLIDGRLHWFVAHLVAKQSWWHGRAVVVMNAQYLGDWDMAPKSHPNDGLLDVFDGDLPLGQRVLARQRLRLGTHVPHPSIEQRRVPALQIEFARPTPIALDGERVGSARRLSVRAEPDALRCVV